MFKLYVKKLLLRLVGYCVIFIVDIHMSQANWQFDGKLIIPPVCQLSQENPINISFGKVAIRKIDGINFKKDIPYQLKCDGDINQPWDVSLKFSGQLAGNGFDKSTLSTRTALNKDKLGIQLQNSGKPQPLNEYFSINIKSPPELSAVPIKKSGDKLVADNFTATGTLMIDFQ